MPSKKVNMTLLKSLLADVLEVNPEVLVIGVADDEGVCAVFFEGQKFKVAAVVNEVMGHAVKEMPKLMQEVMLAEILGSSKAERVN